MESLHDGADPIVLSLGNRYDGWNTQMRVVVMTLLRCPGPACWIWS